jgi:hypothetical protein
MSEINAIIYNWNIWVFHAEVDRNSHFLSFTLVLGVYEKQHSRLRKTFLVVCM